MRMNKRKISRDYAHHPDAATNYEGGLAFKQSPKAELVSRVVTCLWQEPKFYDSKGDDTANAILRLVPEVAKDDPEFILKLAAYTRNVAYLRTVPQVLLVSAAEIPACRPYVRKWAPAIIQRADEPAEVIAGWIARHGDVGDQQSAGMLPASLKKGISDALRKFDEYQLAKHDHVKASVRLRDVFRICHPKPRNEKESDLWRRAINDELSVPETWETYISAHGSSKETWEHILPKMGYMAVLRNLRNLLKHGVNVREVVDIIADERRVRASKQFPFRFFSAYRAVEEMDEGDPFHRREVLNAVATALEYSVESVPHFDGRTAILVDVSGSMSWNYISKKSSVRCIDIAAVMAAIMYVADRNSIIVTFANNADVLVPGSNRVMDIVKIIRRMDGGATYAYKAVDILRERNIDVSRIILLSDMQCYTDGNSGFFVDSLSAYRRYVKHPVHLYSIDLNGYGTAQVPEDDPDTTLLAGWSDNIFRFMETRERGMNALLKEIGEYKA